MNKQVNYIIYAMLLSLTLPIGYYFIDKIVSAEVVTQKQIKVVDFGEMRPIRKSVSIGKMQFQSRCASCHQVFKNSVGPALMNLEERGQWSNRDKLYEWIAIQPGLWKKTFILKI